MCADPTRRHHVRFQNSRRADQAGLIRLDGGAETRNVRLIQQDRNQGGGIDDHQVGRSFS